MAADLNPSPYLNVLTHTPHTHREKAGIHTLATLNSITVPKSRNFNDTELLVYGRSVLSVDDVFMAGSTAHVGALRGVFKYVVGERLGRWNHLGPNPD